MLWKKPRESICSIMGGCSAAKSCPTLYDPMDCGPPGSSVHGSLQARILECVAMPSSRGSSQPRDRTWVSCIGRQILYHWASREAFISFLISFFSHSVSVCQFCCYIFECTYYFVYLKHFIGVELIYKVVLVWVYSKVIQLYSLFFRFFSRIGYHRTLSSS